MSDVLIVIGIVVFAIALGVVGIIATAKQSEREKAEWQTFVDEHDCRVVELRGAQSGTAAGPVIGFDGKMSFSIQTTTTPAQECWLCSNGMRFWKKAGLAVDRARGQ